MQWNVGGWFGAQVGGTAWILIAGMLAALRDLPTGLIALLLFAIPNAIGVLLWRRRGLSCYASTQLLLGIMGGCGLLTIYVLRGGGLWEQIQTGATVSARSSYGIVALVFLVLMLVFYWRFGRGQGGPAT